MPYETGTPTTRVPGACAGSGTGDGQRQRPGAGRAQQPGQAGPLVGVDLAQCMVETDRGEPARAFPPVVLGNHADDAVSSPDRCTGHPRPRRRSRVGIGPGRGHGQFQRPRTKVGQRRDGPHRMVQFAEGDTASTAPLEQREAGRVHIDDDGLVVGDPPERHRCPLLCGGCRDGQHGEVDARVRPCHARLRRPLGGPVGIAAHGQADRIRHNVSRRQHGAVGDQIPGTPPPPAAALHDDLGYAVRIESGPGGPGLRAHRPAHRPRSARSARGRRRPPAGGSA